jgi:transposase
VSREIVTDCLAFPGALAPETGRLDAELRQHARQTRGSKVLTTLPGVGQFTALVMLAEIGDITRFSSARRLASWAGLTLAVRGPGPDRPARAHLQARLGAAAVGHGPGSADRQALPGVRRHLRRHRRRAREQDRHHRDLPQASYPRLRPHGGQSAGQMSPDNAEDLPISGIAS